jgi:two-component system chemotaxis response regulator CheB
MRKIRVLVVDDSSVVRRIVSDVIASDPGLEVAGTAPNGKIALLKIEQSSPDAVTLDVEMPEMDGLSTLASIRRLRPTLPVIMLSSLTERGAAVTLDCLYQGASDYVTKPSGVMNPAETAQRLREQLLPRIRLFGARPAAAAAPRPAAPRPTVHRRGLRRVDLIVVGASTGGPKALPEMLASLPATFPLPILVVQHMPPLFTRTFADRLDSMLSLRTREAVSGETLRGGCVRIAPGGMHLEVERERGEFRLLLHEGPMENSCRPSLDPLFRSASRAGGANVLGVVLTGMGRDGVEGCRDLCSAGGAVIAQDPQSSVIWGMPGAVVEAGLAEEVLPPRELGREIARRAGIGRSAPKEGAAP